eukprot:6515290-Prymnesium_polylepis.2
MTCEESGTAATTRARRAVPAAPATGLRRNPAKALSQTKSAYNCESCESYPSQSGETPTP